jgi:hypothetical protein
LARWYIPILLLKSPAVQSLFGVHDDLRLLVRSLLNKLGLAIAQCLEHFVTGPENRAEEIVDARLGGIEIDGRDASFHAEADGFNARDGFQSLGQTREGIRGQILDGDNGSARSRHQITFDKWSASLQ